MKTNKAWKTGVGASLFASLDCKRVSWKCCVVCVVARQDTLTNTYAHTHHACPKDLPDSLSWLYQIRETCCPSPHRNANEKECTDKRPDPKDERAEGGQRQWMLKGESLLGRWEVAEESVLVVAGDHSLAPPQWCLIQGFCRSFSGALLGGVIPVGLQRASLFIWGWPSRQVAGAVWSCQGEGTSFPGEGTPVPLTFTGAFCWEASQAQVNVGTILTWDSTHPDPMASWEERRPWSNKIQNAVLIIIKIQECPGCKLLLILLLFYAFIKYSCKSKNSTKHEGPHLRIWQHLENILKNLDNPNLINHF